MAGDNVDFTDMVMIHMGDLPDLAAGSLCQHWHTAPTVTNRDGREPKVATTPAHDNPDGIAIGGDVGALMLAVAGWVAQKINLRGTDDLMADTLRRCYRVDPDQTITNRLSLKDVFDLRLTARIDETLTTVYSDVQPDGIGAALRNVASCIIIRVESTN